MDEEPSELGRCGGDDQVVDLSHEEYTRFETDLQLAHYVLTFAADDCSNCDLLNVKCFPEIRYVNDVKRVVLGARTRIMAVVTQKLKE